MAASSNPDQVPGRALYGPESDSTPLSGSERRPGGAREPQTGAQSLDEDESAPQPPEAPAELVTAASPRGSHQEPSDACEVAYDAVYAYISTLPGGTHEAAVRNAHIWRGVHAALEAVHSAELERLRAELDDWRHNVGLRAFTAPDADLSTVLESLDARISDITEALASKVERAFACDGFHGHGCSAADCCGIDAGAVAHFLRTGVKDV